MYMNNDVHSAHNGLEIYIFVKQQAYTYKNKTLNESMCASTKSGNMATILDRSVPPKYLQEKTPTL